MKKSGGLTGGWAAFSAWLETQLMQCRHMRWLVPVLLVLAVLLPYRDVVSGRAIPIPDDVFVSDLADNEFPMRVEAGRVARGGELPVWTPRLMTGLPMMIDPYSVALFAVLPPALALGLLLGTLLAVAALGMYVLARFLGASRSGAFLCGFAFAWSGFFVCQLRHLGVMGTVVYLPWAVYCLEQAAVGRSKSVETARAMDPRRRLLWLAAFGGIFGLQCLAGFPQSAYISALFYAALTGIRCLWLLDMRQPLTWKMRLPPVVAFGVGAGMAIAIGGLIGGAILLPLHELGAISPRSHGGTYEWATYFKYYVPNIFTFLFPYVNGDISDMTYRGRTIFWEDFGYVGLVTFLAGFVAVGLCLKRFFQKQCGLIAPATVLAENSVAVFFWAAAGMAAYLLVLGPATWFYWVLYHAVPGMKTFRFPTRFLFVVEFAIALLGGLGLTYFQAFIKRRVPVSRQTATVALVGVLFAGLTVCDLVWYNKRQNPVVNSRAWLSSPFSVSLIQKSGKTGRVYSPQAKERHQYAFAAARGWQNLAPYYLHREIIQPDSNLLHGLATLDAYAGISPTWSVTLIGDHNQTGMLSCFDFHDPNKRDAFYNWMEALSVGWLVAPGFADTNRVECFAGYAGYDVQRVKNVLPRARFAERVMLVPTPEELYKRSLNGSFDPRREAVLQTEADMKRVAAAQTGVSDGRETARIVADRATEVVVEASSSGGGLLVLSDTYYPGWIATVDSREVPILKVNLAHRGVALPPGTHRVVFAYRSPTVRRGMMLTGVGVALLAGAALFLTVGLRRSASRGAIAK